MKINIRNTLFFLLISGLLIQLATPGAVKPDLIINFYEIPFFATDIVFYFVIVAALFKYGFRLQFVELVIFVGLLFSIISNTLAENNNVARFFIAGNFYISGLLFSILHIKKDNLVSFKYFFWSIYFFLGIQVFFTAIGVFQFESGVQYEISSYIRRGSTAGPATFTGHLFVILAAIMLLIENDSKIKLLIFLVTFILVFLTGTRSAAFALIISASFFYLSNIKKYYVYKLFGLMVIFIIANYIFDFIGTLEARNLSAYDDSDISSGRFERIDDALGIFTKNVFNSIFGIGGAASPYFYQDSTIIKPIISPHNQFISVLVENGVIGILIFIILIVHIIFKLIKNKSIENILLISIILCTFNTEVIGQSYVFSTLFWIYYYASIKN